MRDQNLVTYGQAESQALHFLLPSTYVVDKDQYYLHLVLFAQLKAGATDPVSQKIGSYKKSEYYVPCLPVKYLDVYKLNPDFHRNLAAQYYDDNLPA